MYKYRYIYIYTHTRAHICMSTGRGGLNHLFVQLAADFVEMRFGRPVCGTILDDACYPPSILNMENPKKKKEVSLLVETVAGLYGCWTLMRQICKSGCSAATWFAVYLPCALSFSNILFRWQRMPGVN